MEYMTNESPARVIPLVGAAVCSLMLLFTVALVEPTTTSISRVFEPAKAGFALSGEAMIASWDFSEEAVYATAVYTGIIPFEESSYYAVDLPFHGVDAKPQVAGVVTTTPSNEAVLDSIAVIHDLPWQMLYQVFGGK